MNEVIFLVEEAPEGGYTVTSPVLPELLTEGDSLAEAQANVRDAFEAVEHAKSRTLVDLLANNVSAVHPNRESDRELVEYSRTLREELNWYYTRINIEEHKAAPASHGTLQTLGQEVQKREHELMKLLRQVSAGPAGDVTLQRVVASSLEEIQASIPEDTALIEFYIAGEAVIAFALTRDGFHVVPDLASEPALRTTFELLHFQLTKFNLGPRYVEKSGASLLNAAKEHLHELYRDPADPQRPSGAAGNCFRPARVHALYSVSRAVRWRAVFD